ncbi:MAG TPA: DUF72 domain-containing protein [Oculatellaceae cyanobacterium]
MPRKAQPRMCRIGASGWSYPDWKHVFYPADLPDREFLAFYAEHFNTVEVNNSFYRLPRLAVVRHWAETTPPGFLFSVKGSRYITHIKRLQIDSESLERFLAAIEPFRKMSKLGPILFQLPGRWHVDLARLEAFIHLLPEGYLYAFEFRDPNWLVPEVFQLLKERNIACCIYDFKGLQSPVVVTADFVYLRFHGPGKTPYTGRYSHRVLQEWSQRIREWLQTGLNVYCYFDNTADGAAIQDAEELTRLCAGQAVFGSPKTAKRTIRTRHS